MGQMGFLEGAVIVFATMLKQAKIVDAVITILRWMGSFFFFLATGAANSQNQKSIRVAKIDV